MTSDKSLESASDRARRAAQRQLDAYNAHDVEAFVSCYHDDVQVLDQASGEILMSGRAAMREQYAAMFAKNPEVHANVTTRMVVDRFAFDRETVTGRGSDTLDVVAIYEVDEQESITRVWFVR